MNSNKECLLRVIDLVHKNLKLDDDRAATLEYHLAVMLAEEIQKEKKNVSL